MARAYRKKASNYDFEDYINDELGKTSLTRQDEMKFRDGLTANEAINMARKYNIITREEAKEYRKELNRNSMIHNYESNEQLNRLTALWKDIEDISTHARSQLEVKLHSYSELNAYVKRITADLKRIKAMLD